MPPLGRIHCGQGGIFLGIPIFYSALLLTGVNLALRLVGTSFQVYLSGVIGPGGVGLLQLTLSVGNLAMVAAMAGVRTASMYLTAEELGKGKPQNVRWVLSGCFRYSIVWSLTIATALVLFARQIALSWVGTADAQGALELLGACLPITCLCGVMTGYFTAAGRIGTLAAVEIAEQGATMAFTAWLLALWGASDRGRACCCVVLGSSLGACLTLLVLVALRLRERGACGPAIPVGRRLAAAALPLGAADVMRSGISTAENLMVPKRLALHPGTADPLAAFGLVSGMVFPVLMFPACILFGLAELLLPELARCAAAGSRGRIAYLVKRSLKVALLYGVAFCGLEHLLAPQLGLALYDSLEAGQALGLYALLMPMLYCDAITDAMTKGLGQQKACVAYNILTSAMDVALLFVLLPRYGMQGYFISFFITHLVNFALSLRRLLKISQVKIPFFVPALTVSSTLVSLWAGKQMGSPALSCLAYLGMLGSLLVLTGILGREDVRWVRGMMHLEK